MSLSDIIEKLNQSSDEDSKWHYLIEELYLIDMPGIENFWIESLLPPSYSCFRSISSIVRIEKVNYSDTNAN